MDKSPSLEETREQNRKVATALLKFRSELSGAFDELLTSMLAEGLESGAAITKQANGREIMLYLTLNEEEIAAIKEIQNGKN